MSLLQCGYCSERGRKSPKIGRAATTPDGELWVEWKNFANRPGHQADVEAGARADVDRALAGIPDIPEGQSFVIGDAAVRPFVPSTRQEIFDAGTMVVLRCPRCKAALRLDSDLLSQTTVYLKGWLPPRR